MAFTIVIEGVDSSGKTTLCKKMSKINQGVYLSTPSEGLKKKLKDLDKADNKILGFICFLHSVFETSNKIKNNKNKKLIICDRYYPTLFAYSKALNFKNNFIKLNKLPIEKPNIIIHLFVEYHEIQRRLRNKKSLTIDELRILRNKNFYNKLIEEYKKNCDVDIDATNLSPKEIISKINKEVKRIK